MGEMNGSGEREEEREEDQDMKAVTGVKDTLMEREGKELTSDRIATLGPPPCDPGLIWSAGAAIPEGEAPGLTALGGDRGFIPCLEVQNPFFE